uniref:Uncharacterized protein n=1 Tax=Malurus cyaneus samueli TaxID=2593467 RepID=A0A8C5TGV2_9PASS
MSSSTPRKQLSDHRQWQVATLINTFTGRAAVHAELQILALLIGHHQLLGHANGHGQVVPKLTDIHCGPDVPGIHLNVFATDFLHDLQAPGVPISSCCCTINKSCRQVISHCLIHFLIYTVLIRFEDNSYLGGRGKKSKMGFSNNVSFKICSTATPHFSFRQPSHFCAKTFISSLLF